MLSTGSPARSNSKARVAVNSSKLQQVLEKLPAELKAQQKNAAAVAARLKAGAGSWLRRGDTTLRNTTDAFVLHWCEAAPGPLGTRGAKGPAAALRRSLTIAWRPSCSVSFVPVMSLRHGSPAQLCSSTVIAGGGALHLQDICT